MRGSPDQPLSAAADPLRPSAGGASPDVATSDTLCRPVGATARSPISRVRRLVPRLSSGVDAPHVARTPDDATRLEATSPMSPGCLPSVRSRSCDRAKPSAFPVTFARKSSHPFHPMRSSVSRQDPPPQRATPCNLGLPRGSPRWRGEDASLRPLQPTLDTSTRGPLDFRARSLRCADRRMLPPPHLIGGAGFFLATPDRLATIRPRLGARLTARLQLRPIRTRLCSPFGELQIRAPPLWRRLLGVAFSTTREADVRPLTLPVAPRSLPEFVNPGHFRGTRTASAAPSSKRATFPIRSAFPRQVLPNRFAHATRLV